MVYVRAIKKLAFSFAVSGLYIVLLSGCAPEQSPNSQTSDDQWSPSVSSPEYPQAGGPVVLVDAAHGNFHTIDGRFTAFAVWLERDVDRV